MANIPAAHMRQFTPENLDDIETVVVETDLLIIGGGNAGCFVATEAALVDPNVRVTIMEKAEIMRSGACSAGMDAINTYIPEGKTPEDLVRWSRAQVGGGPLREDLALSNARELNESVDDLERWGLPILRDEQGRIRYRGKWDISIHGEQLKPIMAEKALESGADVYNRVTATALIMHEGRCTGAMGFGVRDGKFYIFRAKATVVSTGGAGTLYKSYTADSTDSGAQIWMCPYCVGTGYAIGFRQGAELTSLEQRWVATRTKDFCGPVDTISVGYGAPIINAHGERVMSRYEHLGGDAAPRYIRANAPMEEWLAGRGPCYCDTTHLTPETAKAMMEDYLNERPSFVLFLASVGIDAGAQFVQTVLQGDGLLYVLWGFLITVIPLLAVGIFARAYFKVNYFILMGVIGGATTDPPALAYSNQVAGNPAPSVGYSTVYPLTMFLRILAGQMILLTMM